MFELEEYKNYLTNYCKYDCDRLEEKVLERQKKIESDFSDEKLNDICRNTEKFLKYFIEECLKEEKEIFSISISSEIEKISTNCTGGWYPDVLIPVSKIDSDNKASLYLLKKFLGDDFKINYNTKTPNNSKIKNKSKVNIELEIVILGNIEALKEKYDILENYNIYRLVRSLEANL